ALGVALRGGDAKRVFVGDHATAFDGVDLDLECGGLGRRRERERGTAAECEKRAELTQHRCPPGNVAPAAPAAAGVVRLADHAGRAYVVDAALRRSAAISLFQWRRNERECKCPPAPSVFTWQKPSADGEAGARPLARRPSRCALY